MHLEKPSSFKIIHYAAKMGAMLSFACNYSRFYNCVHRRAVMVAIGQYMDSDFT